MIRAQLMFAFAIVTLDMPSFSAFAEEKPPTPATITNPLDVGRNTSSTITDQDADRIIGSMSGILVQCHSQASRQGAVHVTSSPGTINSEADMAAACGSRLTDGPAPAGVPRKVRVVNAINWCSKITPNVIGCSYTPGTCLVVVRFSAQQEGILWAHEFGHTKGLQHRIDDPNAVMQPVIGSTHINFNGAECNAIRQLGLSESSGSPQATNARAMSLLPIQDFVSQTFSEGVPFAEAREYKSADLKQIIPWLSQADKMPYWANIVTVIGMVADPQASQILRNRINATGTGALQLEDYKSRVAAIISLGYVANLRSDSITNKFLTAHNNPSSWSKTVWKAPYHASDAERNNDLAAADLLALGLIGTPEAEGSIVAAEKGIDTNNPDLASFLAVIKEAKDSNSKIRRDGLVNYYSKTR